jgi:hypothetical protein
VMRAKQTFILGYYRFCLQSQCPGLLESLERLLPTIEWQLNDSDFKGRHSQQVHTVDLDSPIQIDAGERLNLSSLSAAHSVAFLIDRALKFHQGLIWLEAAALVDKKGNLVLICGSSQSGKTTLSLALAASLHWKIVSEDLILIDEKTAQIVPFARPLGLREDSFDRIVDAVAPVKLIAGSSDEWYFDSQLYYYKGIALNFSTAILLGPANLLPSSPLSIEEVESAEYLRKILPIANCVHIPGAIELVAQGLKKTTCFVVKGGQLTERLRFMESIEAKRSIGVG